LPILPWACAHGEPPAVTLVCAATVALAPPDDSVDTNAVVITGFGSITSFGNGPAGVPIEKRVTFRPDATKTITLTHSAALVLLPGVNRVINATAIGTYLFDGISKWTETSFSGSGASDSNQQIAALAARVTNLETAMTTLQGRVTSLETRMTSLENRVTVLEGGFVPP
jgi:hypothetical protein